MPSERKYQAVCGEGAYYLYNIVVFGGGASPLVWGQVVALLGRSGQARGKPCSKFVGEHCQRKDRSACRRPSDCNRGAGRAVEEQRLNTLIVLLCWVLCASPLGYGGFVAFRCVPIGWFVDALFVEDEAFPGIIRGDCRKQGLAEALAVLVSITVSGAAEVRLHGWSSSLGQTEDE
eukprot:3426250-Amphidinium_carterae.1